MKNVEIGVLPNSYGAVEEGFAALRGAVGGVNLFCLPSAFSELMRLH